MKSYIIILFTLVSSLSSSQTKSDTQEFSFLSHGDTIYGEIRMPKGVQNPPLIVFLPGANDSSYKTNYKRYIDSTMFKLWEGKYAILNFDKPGLGKSTGKWWNETLEEHAEHAIHAIRYAKSHFAINPDKIGITGHSQGGWLVQIISQKYADEITLGLSLAGPATSILEQDMEVFTSEFLCEGKDKVTARELAVQKAFDLYARVESDTITEKSDLHYFRIKSFDPQNIIKNIHIPVLFAFGGNDEYVFAEKAVNRMHQIFRGSIPNNIEIHTIAGVDHSLIRNIPLCFQGNRSTITYNNELNELMDKFVVRYFK